MAITYQNVCLFNWDENEELDTTNDNMKIPKNLSIYEKDNKILHVSAENGDTSTELMLSKEIQCAQVSSKQLVINTGSKSVLLRFQSDTDTTSCLQRIKDAKKRSLNVFELRTESASAEQYFQFYGYLSQQQNMMQDFVRTSTYQRAMLDNCKDFTDKVVLDVGAGSGILSFFAIQAGAKKVYAIEASSMAIHCQTLVQSNKLKDKIVVIAGKIEEVDIPEQVDTIISEPMGYMLFNERMLESYLHAKKWLKPGGKMFPSQGDLHISPFTDDALYMEQFSKANFWYQQSFYGVDLESLREEAVKEYFKQPIVDTFDIGICLARSHKYTVNFQTADEKDLHNIDIPLMFTAFKTGSVHGLAFWFDTAFIGSENTIWLSTAPTQSLTHWYQVRCLLKDPIYIKQGQTLAGRVLLSSNARQSYDVHIELSVPGTNLKSSNVLDLKNPFFRYTGATQQLPQSNTVSPSDTYWNQTDPTAQTVPQQAQQNAYSPMNALLNGGSTLDVIPQAPVEHQSNAQQQPHQNVVPIGSQIAPVNPGSIPSATVMNSRTSIGAGVSPSYFSQITLPSSSISNQLMIGDYMLPGNLPGNLQGNTLPAQQGLNLAANGYKSVSGNV